LTDGDDKVALDSLYSLYKTSRELLKTAVPEEPHGKANSFGEVAIRMLNGPLRDFLSKWHVKLENGRFTIVDHNQFREELRSLQSILNESANQIANLVMRSA
jgi:hypothetical protein